MKYTRFFLLICTSLLFMQVAISQTLSQNEQDARTVLTRYFDALGQGDTSTLRSLIGGDLLRKRARLLDNPTYPSHLVEVYRNAGVQFDQFTTRENDTVVVDVIITLATGEKLKQQFLLAKDPGSDNRPFVIRNETAVQ